MQVGERSHARDLALTVLSAASRNVPGPTIVWYAAAPSLEDFDRGRGYTSATRIAGLRALDSSLTMRRSAPNTAPLYVAEAAIPSDTPALR